VGHFWKARVGQFWRAPKAVFHFLLHVSFVLVLGSFFVQNLNRPATRQLQALTFKYPNTKIAVNCHSNVGFLQADTNGVTLLREYIDLEQGSQRFFVAGNSAKFIRWLRDAYAAPCTYLPNIYYLDYTVKTDKPVYSGGTLRIGAFGATRPQKNLMSAAGAALSLHEELKVDTEFWISGGRMEGGGNTILNSVKAMVQCVVK
jgi:hypothetical protein